MFTYSRRTIATIGAALTLGLFSTTALPVLSGTTGQAQAKAKKKTKAKTKTKKAAKVVRTRLS